MTNTWLILRCSNASTLKLADSLNAGGIVAWTPRETVDVRGKKVPAPIMKGAVFADAGRLGELLMLEHSLHEHPAFWLFRLGGELTRPLKDWELDGLRLAERKRKPRGTVRMIEVDAKVRLSDGGFQGLPGTVVSTTGKFAMVAFDRFPIPVKVGMWLLKEELDLQASDGVHGLKAA